MSYSVDLTFRGLAIDAEIEDYDPGVRTFSNGDPGYPPSGGCCYDFDWEVDDIDELLCELEIESEGVENMVRAFYRICGKLPDTLIKRIERDWEEDIMEAATEYFWQDVGGPGGYEDYCYDG